MKTSYEPLGYRVLVKFFPTEEKTSGGIILAEQTRKNEQQAQVRATVVAVGPDAFNTYTASRIPEPGDVVLVAKYGGFQVPGEENKLLVIYNDEDIAAVEVPQ